VLQEFFGRLNNRDYGATGFFAPKPFFDQRQAFILYGSAQPGGEERLTKEPGFQYQDIKKKYDRSRATVTRTGRCFSHSCAIRWHLGEYTTIN